MRSIDCKIESGPTVIWFRFPTTRRIISNIYTVKEKTETITRGDKEDSNPEPDVKDFEYLSDIKVHTEVEKPRGGGRVHRATVVSRYAKGTTVAPPTLQMWEEILGRFAA
jgi:hypothetical protein